MCIKIKNLIEVKIKNLIEPDSTQPSNDCLWAPDEKESKESINAKTPTLQKVVLHAQNNDKKDPRNKKRLGNQIYDYNKVSYNNEKRKVRTRTYSYSYLKPREGEKYIRFEDQLKNVFNPEEHEIKTQDEKLQESYVPQLNWFDEPEEALEYEKSRKLYENHKKYKRKKTQDGGRRRGSKSKIELSFLEKVIRWIRIGISCGKKQESPKRVSKTVSPPKSKIWKKYKPTENKQTQSN